MSGPRLIRMPPSGLFRVERWADLYVFPSPPARVALSTVPVRDGERWQDLFGNFATAKSSSSAQAAIGRTVAFYRSRPIEVQGSRFSVFDAIKRWLVAEQAQGPSMPRGNQIPPAYFDDAYLMHLARDDDVEFVDLEHPLTRTLLEQQSGHLLASFGVSQLGRSVSSNRDRRITRLVTSSLQEWCTSVRGYEHVAGLRYRAPDPGWDAYVIWEPVRIDFEGAEIRPLGPCDADVRSAATHLGLDDPCP
jgi:hypothetical protein